MSVINKMLKDLEQREQEQEAELEPSNAIYQPKANNKLPIILGLMFVVILALAGAVTWLLLKSQAQQPSLPMQTKVAEQSNQSSEAVQPVASPAEPMNKPEVAEPTPQPKVLSRSPVYVPAQTESQQVEPEQETVQATAESETAAMVEQEVVSEQEPTADLVEPQVVVEQEMSDSPEPVEKVSNEAEPTQFKIEKTPSNLTREQRLEKLMEKAKSSFDKGYITDAITQLEEVLNSADNHVEARNLLAVAWYGRGELQQAVNILNNGLNRYPNIEKWRLTAAKIFFKENELQGAFSYLEADLASASVEYYSMKGTLARQLKRFDKAETAYASLTKLEPEKGGWWLGYAIALDSQNKSAMAVQSYKQAITQAGISAASIQFAQQRIQKLQE